MDYFGHTGNQGDAVARGEALGATATDMAAYQGHGSVATPHGVLITWALMTEGGIQINARGERFSNEHVGYSEQCVRVLEQPGGVAWNVYDERLHRSLWRSPTTARPHGRRYPARARRWRARAADRRTGDALARTLAAGARSPTARAVDPFGRDFTGKPKLAPPYYAVKVTGALFHTQGGLEIDRDARVLERVGRGSRRLRRRRCGARRVGRARLGLSVGQRTPHRDDPRPHRRCERGRGIGQQAGIAPDRRHNPGPGFPSPPRGLADLALDFRRQVGHVVHDQVPTARPSKAG